MRFRNLREEMEKNPAMIVAIDTNCILPGQVGGIENYTLGLIEALKRPTSPASKLILLTRPENRDLFAPFVDADTTTILQDRPTHNGKPIPNWAEFLDHHADTGPAILREYQNQKATALQQHRVEVLHCPGNTINPLNLPVPIVLNLHDLQHRHFPEYFTQQELDNREKWWVASAHRADAMIAASNYVRDDLNRQLGIPAAKIFVTPDVFESAFFQPPGAKELTDLRARFNLPEMFFIYPAACWPHKNHERLIQAFVAANLPGVQLVLTGGGQEQSNLPTVISDLGAGNSIRLLGRVETQELVGLYHLAMGMIFPSQHESWSIPIMEAMACGCPVVCSDVTSLPEEIGDAGLLFPPDNVNEMTAAIRQLANDAGLRRVLARRGRERIKQFSSDSFLTTISSAYRFARQSFYIRKVA